MQTKIIHIYFILFVVYIQLVHSIIVCKQKIEKFDSE